MAKKIECAKCFKDLGYIENNSRIRKGIIYLCKECYEKLKIAEFALDKNNKANPLGKYGNIFGL